MICIMIWAKLFLFLEKYYDAEEEQKQELAKKRKRLKEFGQDGSSESVDGCYSNNRLGNLQKFVVYFQSWLSLCVF